MDRKRGGGEGEGRLDEEGGEGSLARCSTAVAAARTVAAMGHVSGRAGVQVARPSELMSKRVGE